VKPVEATNAMDDHLNFDKVCAWRHRVKPMCKMCIETLQLLASIQSYEAKLAREASKLQQYQAQAAQLSKECDHGEFIAAFNVLES
jgi:hypothetical protein